MCFYQVVLVPWQHTFGQLDAVVGETVINVGVQNIDRGQVYVGSELLQVQLLVILGLLLGWRDDFTVIALLHRENASGLLCKIAVVEFRL